MTESRTWACGFGLAKGLWSQAAGQAVSPGSMSPGVASLSLSLRLSSRAKSAWDSMESHSGDFRRVSGPHWAVDTSHFIARELSSPQRRGWEDRMKCQLGSDFQGVGFVWFTVKLI